MARRAWWFSTPQNCVGERGRSNLHTILHNDGPSSGFAERNTGTLTGSGRGDKI